MDTTRWDTAFHTGAQSVTPEAEPSAQQTGPCAPVEETIDPEYPFEEPEQAPELRSQRSESLYTRSEPFWERVIELPAEGEEYPRDANYWNHPEELADDRILHVDSGRLRDKVRRCIGSRTLWILLAVIAVALGAWLIIHSAFMQIKSISVVGSTSFTEAEIIALSQLEKGMSTFDIDEELVMQRIERNRYLRCTLVDVAFDKVVLHVSQRVPVASIRHNGRLATLDERGWVLEVTNDLTQVDDTLITITGMDVHRCSLGQAVTLNTPSRLTVYTQILIELRAMGGLDLIEELDMTSMDSISLKTKDDFTVQLGNETRIHEKLRAMLIVREVVLEKGYYGQEEGGTIVVSDPTGPTYMPLGGQ